MPATLDHGCGVVHGNDPAAVTAHMAAQRLGDGAQRRAQVVQRGVCLGEARGHHAEVFDDGWVTGHRALDHVREHTHHILVEGEIRYLPQRLGKQAVGRLAHGGLEVEKLQKRILSKGQVSRYGSVSKAVEICQSQVSIRTCHVELRCFRCPRGYLSLLANAQP
ncbi:hypothetical protein D9M71_471910 [compost metagenome]